MCGRYVSPETAELERLFHIGRHNGNPFKQRYNVAPTMEIPVLTCAVLTTDAAPSVAPVHERMPVVLDFHTYADWLDPELQDAARALAVASEGMQTEFGHHPVSLRINSKVDDESLCEPI